MRQVSSEWCSLDPYGQDWRSTHGDRMTFCIDFWKYFDWEEPEPGEEMRIIFSSQYVRGAQKSMFKPIDKHEWCVPVIHEVGLDPFLILYTPIDRILNCLFDRRMISDDKRVAVYWWPEYRDGESK